MFRARLSIAALAIVLAASTVSSARAQNGPGLPTGSVLAGEQQSEVVRVPMAQRFGSILLAEVLSTRQWILDRAAGQRLRSVPRTDAGVRRAVPARAPVWVP